MVRVERTNEIFQLFVDDVLVECDSQALGLVPALVKLLDVEVVRRLNTLRAVHAGAVLWDERVLLLPGATHAGKSSLVAEFSVTAVQNNSRFSQSSVMLRSGDRVLP